MNKSIYNKNYTDHLGYEGSKKEFNRFNNYFNKNYLKYIPKNKNIFVLDIGCGNGIFLNYLKKIGYKKIFGIDLSNENIRIAKKSGLNVSEQDAFKYLINKKNQYNLIVLNDVIEHFEKNKALKLLKLIHNSLVSNGSVFIKTMNMSNSVSTSTLFSDFSHEWGYTEKSISQICKLAGFINIKIKNLVIYPNNKLLDWIFPIIYRFIIFRYKIQYLFYGKKNYKIFSKNLLCIAKKHTK